MKNKADKLDVDELVPDPADLSKLSDVVKTDVVKRDVAKIKDIEDKTHGTTDLVTSTALNYQLSYY